MAEESQTPFPCIGIGRVTRFHCDAQMLNVLADGLPGIVAYFDAELKCHFINGTVEAWTGAKPAAFVDRNFGDVSSEFALEIRPHLARALAGAHVEFEAPAHFAGGLVNVVRGFAYPDSDGRGAVQGCFVLLLDISRERAIEAQLQVARDQAIEANRSKSRFLAAASHDLRQPLHAITLFVSALSRRLRDGEAAQLVGHIDNSLRSLRSMIDTLLDMSRIEAGLIKPEPSTLAIAELFEAVQPGFEMTAIDRSLKFGVVPTTAHVRADRVLLELALRNLLANAFKFTQAGRVLLGCRRRNGRIGISVADSGVGIAPERARSVFEEFNRTKSAAAGPNEGLGLGLAIVKRLTDLMGGEVTLKSTAGKGSVFTIWLTAATPAAASLAKRQAHPVNSIAGRRILILDDDASCAAALEREFQDQGAIVSSASCVQAAQQSIDEQGPPEAMVVDYNLNEGLTGLQFVQALGLTGRRTSVILISGSTDADTIAALSGSGLPWLTKPVDPRVLRSTLINSLAR